MSRDADDIHAEVWLPHELDDAIDEARILYCLRNRADAIRVLLANALRADGLWPPRPKGGTPPDRKGGAGGTREGGH